MRQKMIVIARGNWQAVLGAKIRRYKQNFGIKSFYIKETPQILDCRSFLFFCDLFMQCTLRVQGIIRVNIKTPGKIRFHKFFFVLCNFLIQFSPETQRGCRNLNKTGLPCGLWCSGVSLVKVCMLYNQKLHVPLILTKNLVDKISYK